MRQVKQDSVHRRMCLENGRDLRSVTATNIDDCADSGKVVGAEHRLRLATMNANHGRIEDTSLVVVLAQVVEDGHAEHFVERFVAGLNAIFDLGPSPKLLITGH